MIRLGLPGDTQIDWALLDIALTHPTVGVPNYEQLEFIGDSVVRLAASEFLWETYPDKSVGDFSAIRKVLVSDRILAQLADGYGFDRYLTLAASAIGDPSGRVSRLADAFEAVLAALYLTTNNLKLVRPWLDPHFQQSLRKERYAQFRTQGKYRGQRARWHGRNHHGQSRCACVQQCDRR